MRLRCLRGAVFRQPARSMRGCRGTWSVCDDFRITDAQWDSLLIPIEMAFFFESSTCGAHRRDLSEPGRTDRVAAAAGDVAGHRRGQPRPEPDGAGCRSAGRQPDWVHIVTRQAPTRSACEYYILPIDECFKLVGVIRLHWKGLSGGTASVGGETFFAEILRQGGAHTGSVPRQADRGAACLISTFEIRSAAAVPFAATPLVSFRLEVVNARLGPARPFRHVRCQIQIEATRRRYDAAEQERLLDLFGEPERWSTTLKPMLWTHTTVALPQFVDRAAIDVPVPCSYDFNVAATKYFDGLLAGEIPLNFLFSGTVFYEADTDQALQVAPISWDKEARFRLPVVAWRDLMDALLPEQRLAASAPRHVRSAGGVQAPSRDRHVGRGVRPRSVAAEVRSGESPIVTADPVDVIARTLSLRRVPAVSVPALRGEESAALQFRRAVSRGLLRTSEADAWSLRTECPCARATARPAST